MHNLPRGDQIICNQLRRIFETAKLPGSPLRFFNLGHRTLLVKQSLKCYYYLQIILDISPVVAQWPPEDEDVCLDAWADDLFIVS